MKKLILLLLFTISFHKTILCQTNAKITDVDFRLENNSIVINYYISGYLLNELFTIGLKFLTETNQEIIPMTTTGHIGDNIKGEGIKTITWDIVADKLEVYGVLKASVTIIKAEIINEVPLKLKSKDGPTNALLSVLMPGLRQTRASEGKPWWLMGVVAYGALAGGFVADSKFKNTWNSYKSEEDPLKRSSLFSQAQKLDNISRILFISSATIWAANIIWIAMIPDKYKPVKNLKISFYQSNCLNKGMPLLTLRCNF